MHGLAVANGRVCVEFGEGVWLREVHLGTTNTCFCGRSLQKPPIKLFPQSQKCS